jgi:hypothetical protein
MDCFSGRGILAGIRGKCAGFAPQHPERECRAARHRCIRPAPSPSAANTAACPSILRTGFRGRLSALLSRPQCRARLQRDLRAGIPAERHRDRAAHELLLAPGLSRRARRLDGHTFRTSFAGDHPSVRHINRDHVSACGGLASGAGTAGKLEGNRYRFAALQSARSFSLCSFSLRQSSVFPAPLLRSAILLQALSLLCAGSIRVRLWAVVVTAGSFSDVGASPLARSRACALEFLNT